MKCRLSIVRFSQQSLNLNNRIRSLFIVRNVVNNSLSRFNKIRFQPFRTIDTNSWAADKLQENGEKLETGPELPLTEYNEELLNSPPDHVKELCNTILTLTVVEMHQLSTIIQVFSFFIKSVILAFE
jgi:hypothetical protein